MKKLWFLMLTVGCLAACGTSRTAEDKAARTAKLQRQVADSLQRRTYTVCFDYVSPQRLPARHLTSEYSIRVDGDRLTSFLPFFGVAYRSEYPASSRSPFDFTATLRSYAESPMKRDGRRILMTAMRNSDRIQMQLEVFSNGAASLHVTSDDREPISYTGYLKIND